MNKTTPLIDSLFGKTKKSIIGILFSKPDEHLHLRELARLADVSAPAMGKELKLLSESGVVKSWRDGNRVQYQANRDCIVFEELRGIARKTVGVADVIKTALDGADIKLAFIFGSIATGKDRNSSDIDLMVVGDIDAMKLYALIAPLEDVLRRPIHINHYDTNEWIEVSQDRLVKKILDGEKITVINDEG